MSLIKYRDSCNILSSDRSQSVCDSARMSVTMQFGRGSAVPPLPKSTENSERKSRLKTQRVYTELKKQVVQQYFTATTEQIQPPHANADNIEILAQDPGTHLKQAALAGAHDNENDPELEQEDQNRLIKVSKRVKLLEHK